MGLKIEPDEPLERMKYTAEGEKELSFITTQLRMGQHIHGGIQKSLDTLRGFGYPESERIFIIKQFKKPVGEREPPKRSPEVEKWLAALKDNVAKVFTGYTDIPIPKAKEIADKMIQDTLAKHPKIRPKKICASLQSKVYTAVSAFKKATKARHPQKSEEKEEPQPEIEKKIKLPKVPEREEIYKNSEEVFKPPKKTEYFMEATIHNGHSITLKREGKTMKSPINVYIDDTFWKQFPSEKIAKRTAVKYVKEELKEKTPPEEEIRKVPEKLKVKEEPKKIKIRPEILKEISYINVQLEMGQQMHGGIQKSLDKLHSAGYSEGKRIFIVEQFKKPVGERVLLPERG